MMLTSQRYWILAMAVAIIAMPTVSAQSSYGPTWEEHCSGNTCTRTLYSGPITYWNGSSYVLIDTSISPSSNPLFDYEVTKGLYSAFFKTDPTEGQVIKFIKEGVEITYQPMSLNYRNDLSQIQQISMIQPVSGVPEGSLFSYPEAYGSGIDLTYKYNEDNLKEGLTINSLSDIESPDQYIIDGGNASLDLDFVLTTNSNHIIIDGVDWDKSTSMVTSNEVLIKDNSGDVLYKLNKPYAYDSSYNETELKYQFKKTSTKLYVILKTPYSWIQNADFPITIDPTIQLQNNITENLADLSYYNWTSPQSHCGIFKFNISSIPSSVTVTNATFSFFVYSDGGSSSTFYKMGFDSQTWDQSTSADSLTYIEVFNRTTADITTGDGWFHENVTSIIEYEYSRGNGNASIIIDRPNRDGIYTTNASHTIGDHVTDTETGIKIGDGTLGYGQTSIIARENASDTSLRPYINITYQYNSVSITVDNPTNTSQTSLPIDINITTNDNANWCGFNLDGGSNTTMLGSATNWYSQTNSSLVDGTTYQLNVYCNTTVGLYSLNDSIWFYLERTGIPDIINISWSAAFNTGDTQSLYFMVNNTGDGNLTNCNMTLTSSVGSATFDQSAFTIQPSTPLQVMATFSSLVIGTDGSASILLNCTTNISGSYNTDTVSGSIAVTSSSTSAGGGGGPSFVPECGSYTAYPTGTFTGFAADGAAIPPFIMQIYNGNTSQYFVFDLEGNITDYCHIIEYPNDVLAPNEYGEVVIECIGPPGEAFGHLKIATDTGCEDTRPISLNPSNDIIGAFSHFVLSLVTGGSPSDINIMHILILAAIIVIIFVILLI